MPKARPSGHEKSKKIYIRKTEPEPETEEVQQPEADAEVKQDGDLAETPAEAGDKFNATQKSENQPAFKSKKVKLLREEVLDAIYNPESPESKIQDVKKIVKKNRKTKKLFWALGVLLLLAVASAAGFLVFSRKNNQFNERIDLNLVAPAATAAGDEVNIAITIKNNEKIAIRNSELTFTPPEGFTFKSSTPAPSNEFNNAWDLGTLNKNSGATVTIVGRLVGNQDEEKIFNFTLGYRPANFNYDFQKTTELKIKISSSVLKVTPEVPLRIIAGTPTEFTVTLENTGADKLTEVKLIVDYPEVFKYTSADPKPAEKENIWLFPELAAGGKIKVVISGSLGGSPGETPEFKFRAGREGLKEFEVQAEASGIGTIVKAGLTLGAAITNPGKGTVAAWGETLNYMLTYKNESDGEMQDISLTVEFIQKNAGNQDVSILDLDNRSGATPGKLDGRTITWTKQEVPKLAKVKPGESGDILLRVALKSGPEIKTQEDRNFVIITSARASVASIADVEGKNFETQAQNLQTNITTKLNVEPEARYYSEEQLPVGSGPLPPQVGQTTFYQLSWNLTNPTNEASQIVVSATLPDGVTWTGKQSVTAGQTVVFNAETREVVWRINRVPPGTGSLFASLEAKFEVSITPTAADLGKLLVLLNQTSVTARDEFTSQDLRIEKPILTTDLTNDVAGQGKGLVAPAQ
ncbi:hypothetical protein C4546_04260 [Candidatus Parcubacteria bacterium]|jgi:hypothetical protein|nr:MAG: hypothetical protein C4546_04260 [Candidatus Parcubacteria bacterium]